MTQKAAEAADVAQAVDLLVKAAEGGWMDSLRNVGAQAVDKFKGLPTWQQTGLAGGLLGAGYGALTGGNDEDGAPLQDALQYGLGGAALGAAGGALPGLLQSANAADQRAGDMQAHVDSAAKSRTAKQLAGGTTGMLAGGVGGGVAGSAALEYGRRGLEHLATPPVPPAATTPPPLPGGNAMDFDAVGAPWGQGAAKSKPVGLLRRGGQLGRKGVQGSAEFLLKHLGRLPVGGRAGVAAAAGIGSLLGGYKGYKALSGPTE